MQLPYQLPSSLPGSLHSIHWLPLDTIHQTSDIAEYSEINLLSLFWWLRTVIDAWQSQWPNNNMWHGTAAVILGMFHLVGNSCLFCLLCLQKNVTLSFNLAATSAFSLLLIPKPDFRPCKSPKNVTGRLQISVTYSKQIQSGSLPKMWQSYSRLLLKQCIEICNALTLEVNVKKYTRAFKFSFKINFKTKEFITKIKCHIYLLMISRKIGPPIWGGVTEYLSACFNWKKWHV